MDNDREGNRTTAASPATISNTETMIQRKREDVVVSSLPAFIMERGGDDEESERNRRIGDYGMLDQHVFYCIVPLYPYFRLSV
jgi:hypothetical protein